MEAKKSLLLGSLEALGSIPSPASLHLGKPASLMGRTWRFWSGALGTEDLPGADLFTEPGCFGRSRKEDVIIVTLQNL